MEKEQLQAIKDTAILMTAQQPGAETIIPLIEASIKEIVIHRPSTGGYGTQNWIASLRSFGKVLIAVADREEVKHKHKR